MADQDSPSSPKRGAGLRGFIGEVKGLPRVAVDMLRRQPSALRSRPVSPDDMPALELPMPVLYEAPGPPVRRPAIALTLEADSLRMLIFGERKVGAWANIAIPDGIVADGCPVDSAGFGALLDDTFSQLELSRGPIVASLSALATNCSVLTLPYVEDDALEDVVAGEAAGVLGYSDSEHYLFWQRVPGIRRANSVFVAVASRDTLLVQMEAYLMAGLKVTSIDLKPLALARAVNQRNAILASFEPGVVELAIVVDDLPVLVRGLLVLPDENPFSPVETQMVTEVCRLLATFDDSNEKPLEPTVPIYACGTLAASPILLDQLKLRTGHPLGRLSPPLYIPSDFPLSEQMVNIGLALRGT